MRKCMFARIMEEEVYCTGFPNDISKKISPVKSVMNNKTDWCPLKEVPEKKVLTPYRGHGVVGISELQQNSYQRGYNSCIDEILGGDDDRKQ